MRVLGIGTRIEEVVARVETKEFDSVTSKVSTSLS